MNVRLIAYTQPSKEFVDETNFVELQDIVAYCARVSNPGNQNNPDNEKLIKYLIDHQHWSPLEMVSITLEITTTRDIARQILRHRSFSFQEFSQRYADPTKDLKYDTKEARIQDTKNRQNSIEVNDFEFHEEWRGRQLMLLDFAKKQYEWAIKNNIAKEQARAVLPEGIMESRLYMAGTLRSWIHYIQLRSANGTQKEHREIAMQCSKIISEVFPIITRI